MKYYYEYKEKNGCKVGGIMNREIKFRGKTYNGKWIYGYCYKVKSLFDQQFNWFIRNDYQTDDMIIPETLGQ